MPNGLVATENRVLSGVPADGTRRSNDGQTHCQFERAELFGDRQRRPVFRCTLARVSPDRGKNLGYSVIKSAPGKNAWPIHSHYVIEETFFVATAAADGHVNVSPKGLDSLRIMSSGKIVWLNLSGSGNETAAHVQESNRITLMFCAFEGKPLILRVYGTTKVIYPRHDKWRELIGLFPAMAGSRQMFNIDIELVQSSCGSGVPLYDYNGQRGDSQLLPFYEKMGETGVQKYWKKKNQFSIDGKPTHILLQK